MSNIQEYCRPEVISLAFDATSTAGDDGTFIDRILNLCFEHSALRITRERADVNTWFGGVTDFPRLHFIHKRIHVSVVYFFMYVDALYCATTLTVIVESTICRGCRDCVYVRYIITHIQRIFSTQLTLAGDHSRSDPFVNILASLIGTGKKVSIEGQVQQQLSGRPPTNRDLKRIIRHTRFLQQSLDRDPRNGGILGWLVHDCVSCNERRHEDIDANQVGIIP